MTEVVKEIVLTNSDVAVVNSSPKERASGSETAEYLVYFFFGALEILLAFRLVLKILGANITSTFVSLVYGLSGIFIIPFEGIFRRGFSQGLETTAVLEPATAVAAMVYAVIAWGIVKLVQVLSGERQAVN